MTGTLALWVGFHIFVLAVLAIDLGVFHRKSHEVGSREAGAWIAVWVSLAMLFAGGIWIFSGPGRALDFVTGYIVEESLSVDNIFVFILIFSFFKVPAAHQHRVLFWGILGAIIMRGAMIAAGTTLLQRFHWFTYIFGGFLLWTGLRIAFQKEREFHPDKNPLVRVARRLFTVTSDYHGSAFFVRMGGRLAATPLFLVLLVVETTDVVFAVDSIPAVFAVTTDPFIVYTSNIFAILGLRSLYFLIAGAVTQFRYLKPSLAAILVFVGLKMCLVEVFKLPAMVSLGVIVTILGIGVAASIAAAKREATALRAASRAPGSGTPPGPAPGTLPGVASATAPTRPEVPAGVSKGARPPND